MSYSQFGWFSSKIEQVEYCHALLATINFLASDVPSNLSEQLLRSARVHVDTELSSRLQFILEEYDYVVKDEKGINTAREKILAYAGKTEEEWSNLLERYV